jgi:hypothetical protein
LKMTDISLDQQQKEAAHVALINVTPRGDEQVHLIEFLRATSEIATSADDLLLRLREVCSPEVIAKKSVTNNPNLFLAIRQLLTAYGVSVRRGTGFPVIHGVLEALFGVDPESLQEALQIWKSTPTHTRSTIQLQAGELATPPISNTAVLASSAVDPIQTRSTISRAAQDISRRFPFQQRFSGKMGESPSFADIRNQYLDVCEELEINQQHQVTFLRSALREEAYQFYQDVIKDKVFTLGAAFTLLEETYASVARQEQIKTLLQTLNAKFINTDSTPLEILNEIYSDISRLAVQCSSKYRDDQSKADFLKVAVERQTWARGAVEEYLSNPSGFLPNKFQGFHGRLTAALTARAAAGEGDVSKRPILDADLDIFPTHYGSQYGVRPTTKGRRSLPYPTPNTVRPNVPPRLEDSAWRLLTPEEKKSRRTCFKCGERGHYLGDPECRKASTSMTDAIKARYRLSGGDQLAATTVLFEIAVSFDERERELSLAQDCSLEPSVVANHFFEHLIEEYEGDNTPQNDVLKTESIPSFQQPGFE